MIDMNKKYKTKNGDKVVLTELFEGRVYGRVFGTSSLKWHVSSWSALDGICWENDITGYDLIEVPEFEILCSNTKHIKYFGQDLIVPDWTKYIATDWNSSVYAYSKPRPTFNTSSWVTTGKSIQLTTIKYSGDWTKSLVEV